MTTDINKLIEDTERLLAAAGTGPCEMVIRNDGAGPFADFKYLPQSFLFNAAPTALRELINEVYRLRQQVAKLEFDATTQPNADWEPDRTA